MGAKLNIAWNCVHRWAERRPDEIGAVFLGEDGGRREVSFAELSDEVTRLAEGSLRSASSPATASVIYLPMCARGRDRLARVRAHRRGAGADLLGLRSARGRAAPRGLGSEGA